MIRSRNGIRAVLVSVIVLAAVVAVAAASMPDEQGENRIIARLMAGMAAALALYTWLGRYGE